MATQRETREQRAERAEREEREERSGKRKKAVGTAALLLGAAGLLLFIVGVKRRYRIDDEREIALPGPRGPRAGRRLAVEEDADDGDDFVTSRGRARPADDEDEAPPRAVRRRRAPAAVEDDAEEAPPRPRARRRTRDDDEARED
jgi:hypothetical protein